MLRDERLLGGILAAEAVETDTLTVQINLGADQAMLPSRIYLPAMPQTVDMSRLIRPSEIDDATFWGSLKIEPEVRREGPARWVVESADTSMLGVSFNKPVAAFQQRLEVFMVEALPDLELPATVEGFGDILKALLGRGCEDRDHPKSQAEAHDASDDIRVVVATLEPGVVIELGVPWQPRFEPMLTQEFYDVVRTDLQGRSGQYGALPEGAAGEDAQQGATFQAQIFDDIKVIHLGLSCCRSSQVPAWRWREVPRAPFTIQQSLPS